MTLPTEIVITIVIVVIVGLVILGLLLYCFCFAAKKEETSKNDNAKFATDSSQSAFTINNNVHNLSAARTYFNNDQSSGRSNATNLMNFRNNNGKNQNNNSDFSDDEPETQQPTSIIPKSSSSNNSNKPHIPYKNRIQDGNHLYYTVVSDYGEKALSRALRQTSSAAKEAEESIMTSKHRRKNESTKEYFSPPSDQHHHQPKKQQVFELNLTDVGLGSDSNKYVAFALLCELAADHLPNECYWQEGQVPPLCLASVDLDEAKKCSYIVRENDDDDDYDNDNDDDADAFSIQFSKKIISVVNVEELVGNAVAVRDTANDPLVLMVIDMKQDVRPGSLPIPWTKPSVKKVSTRRKEKKSSKKSKHGGEDEEDDEEDETDQEALHKSYHDAKQDISIDISGIYNPKQKRELTSSKQQQKRRKSSSSDNNSFSTGFGDEEGDETSRASTSTPKSSRFPTKRKSKKHGQDEDVDNDSNLDRKEVKEVMSFSASNKQNQQQQHHNHSLSTSGQRVSPSPRHHQQQQQDEIAMTKLNNRFPTLSKSASTSRSRQSSQVPSSSRSAFLIPFGNENHNNNSLSSSSLILPILAPRIYPYSPIVTTRTPVRITAIQYRDRKTGIFVQDRWKVFALDEVLFKLPPIFFEEIVRRQQQQEVGNGGLYPNSALKKKKKKKKKSNQDNNTKNKNRTHDFDDDDDSSSDGDSSTSSSESDSASSSSSSASTSRRRDEQLPKTIEFASRKSTATGNIVIALPHLAVTARKDGTLIVKSVPSESDKKSSLKAKKKDHVETPTKSQKKKKKATFASDHHHHQRQESSDLSEDRAGGGFGVVASGLDTSSSSLDSSRHSSYGQSTTQILHVDVVPMSFAYKVEGGVGGNSSSSTTMLNNNQHSILPSSASPRTTSIDANWILVETVQDVVASQNRINKTLFKNAHQLGTLGTVVSLASPQSMRGQHVIRDDGDYIGGASTAPCCPWMTTIFLPLGRVCVVAKTRDEAHRRIGKQEPSWSSVFTVNATNKEDTRDYSESAALHFARI